METLNFIKNDKQDWEAEFEATGDFNLHLERSKKGTITILQKTYKDGEYAFSNEFPYYHNNFDFDFTGLIYPKMIKVVSDSEVLLGVVTQ